ncbi:MAG: hypothetical protein ACI9M3_000516, partial [Bacteroidia bacterium]
VHIERKIGTKARIQGLLSKKLTKSNSDVINDSFCVHRRYPLHCERLYPENVIFEMRLISIDIILTPF